MPGRSPEDSFGESKVTNVKLSLQKGTQFTFEKTLYVGAGGQRTPSPGGSILPLSFASSDKTHSANKYNPISFLDV